MHRLIVGNSFSGKSWLAKSFAREQSAAGHNVIVFDPLRSNGWPASAKKFSDPQAFIDYLPSQQNAFVYIDEAKVLWDHDQRASDKILYQYRHKGMLICLIAQRTRMVPPNARNQCSNVFVFRQQQKDAAILAEEYHAGLVEATNLKKIHFLATDGYDLGRYVLDFKGECPDVKKLPENA